MNNKKVVIYVVVLLSVALLLFYSFSMTGFATKNQRLIVSLDILSDQQKIDPGESLLLEVAIRELGGNMEETSFIDLEYSIKDSKENIISSKKESGAIAVKQSEVISLLVPTNIEPGIYTASVDVTYQEEVYTGTKTFEVLGQNDKLNFIYALIIIAIIMAFALYRKKLTRRKKLTKRKKR